MAIEGVGRVYRSGRSLVIRVPVDVARDSTFPLFIGDEVTVTIQDGCKVVVQRLESGRTSNTHNQ